MRIIKFKNSLLMALGVAMFVTGCATSGYQKADQTGKGIAEFRNELVNLKKSVEASLASLSQTTETAVTDPRKAYQTFAKSIDNVEEARARVGKRAAEVKAAGDAYFKQWELELANITNPEIRKLAEERKAKLNEIFGKLRPMLEKARSDFDPFLSDLKDLRSFLGQDLTIGGVDAAKDIIKKTREHGVELEKSLDGLIGEMNSISAQITPAKVPQQ